MYGQPVPRHVLTGPGLTPSLRPPEPTGSSRALGAIRIPARYGASGTGITSTSASGRPSRCARWRVIRVVTVHLDSGTDVVIVEGRATGPEDGAEAIEAYNRKYDWNYHKRPPHPT